MLTLEATDIITPFDCGTIALPDTELLNLARLIAIMAHAGVKRSKGDAYIDHPLRTAAMLVAQGADEVTVAAAILHDVIEDTDYTAEDLIAFGIPAQVVDIVVAVSRQDGEDYLTFCGRAVQHSPEARAIKLADIADNSSHDQLSHLAPEKQARQEAKYKEAMRHIYTL